MTTTNLITLKLDGRSFFSAVYPYEVEQANAVAGGMVDMLADSTGLTFDYEVSAVLDLVEPVPNRDLHDAVAAAFVAVKIPVKNASGRTIVTPENSSLHLTARGAHLLNGHLLAALKMALNALRNDFEPDNQSNAYQTIEALIADAEGVGGRAQSFAERERDLLVASNGNLERARAAETERDGAVRARGLAEAERDSFARELARMVAVKPMVTLWDQYAIAALVGISGHLSGAGQQAGESRSQADTRWAAERADGLAAERAKRNL